jgi:hypothetical protein
MLKRLSFICVCLLFVSVVVTSFHHHDDGADHPECSICLATHQSSDSSYSIARHEIVRPLIATVYIGPVLALVTKTVVTPANDRAPPV